MEDTDCPERTMPLPASSSKIDSPERTGEDTSGDEGGDAGGEKAALAAPSELFKKEEATQESAEGGVSGGAAPWLKMKVRDGVLCFQTIGGGL